MGFAFWVDILDPRLSSLPNFPANSSSIKSLLTACIIEMAIINCTHVITCMTPNSKGSLWIPYEYGRITAIPGYLSAASAWKHPDFPKPNLPEYMHLGLIHTTEKEIEDWHGTELNRKNQKKSCALPEHPLATYPSFPKLPYKN